MKRTFKRIFKKFGYSISKLHNYQYQDIDNENFWEIYNFCKPYTATSIERMYALFNAVNYIISNNVQGDFIECGVWRGGSAMLIAMTLQQQRISDRKIYLFDTFEGMSTPTTSDVNFMGSRAEELLKLGSNDERSILCFASIEDVKQNLDLTKYNHQNVIYVKGKVEETIPHLISIDDIALLRLDTDWYESTKHELNHLYPKVVLNGVLIIDDYGHWAGCRKAVDEYFNDNKVTDLMNRIDYTGRLLIKTRI